LAIAATGSSKKIIPWPISGWPHDINPRSQLLKISKRQNPQKLPKSLGTKRKVVWKGQLGLIDFLPEV
jgi:hypothetical protein